jgi:hypothetical protein
LRTLLEQSGKRFFSILGMFGSDSDGERANAARLATQLLRQHELSWTEISDAIAGAGPAPAPTRNQQQIIMALTAQVKSLNEQLIRERTEVKFLKAALEGAKKENERLRGPKPPKMGYVGGFRPFAGRGASANVVDEIEASFTPSEWEEGFLHSIRQRVSLTPKQFARLKEMADQAGVDVTMLDPN